MDLRKEVLWLFLALIISVCCGFGMIYFIDQNGVDQISQEGRVLEMELFIIGTIIGFIGVYIIRIIYWAISKIGSK